MSPYTLIIAGTRLPADPDKKSSNSLSVVGRLNFYGGGIVLIDGNEDVLG